MPRPNFFRNKEKNNRQAPTPDDIVQGAEQQIHKNYENSVEHKKEVTRIVETTIAASSEIINNGVRCAKSSCRCQRSRY